MQYYKYVPGHVHYDIKVLNKRLLIEKKGEVEYKFKRNCETNYAVITIRLNTSKLLVCYTQVNT